MRGWSCPVEGWEHRKDLKELNPFQVPIYAVAHKLTNEPAFTWWVPFTLKKCERFIKAVATRYVRTDQKFGLELPKTIKRALEI
jgi:hypothetical protein